MRALIKKEIIVNKNYIFIILIMPLFSFVFENENKALAYMIFSAWITYMSIAVIMNQMSTKEGDKIDTLYLSLPIDREAMVKSKYLIYSLFPLIASIYLYFYIVFIQWPFDIHVQNIGFDVIIIATSIALIIMGVLIPLFYQWLKYLQIIFSLFHILIYVPIWFPDRFSGFVINQDVRFDINYGGVSILLPIVAITVYLLSMKISTRILKKRWLKNEKAN